jgi:hypothetical protein
MQGPLGIWRGSLAPAAVDRVLAAGDPSIGALPLRPTTSDTWRVAQVPEQDLMNASLACW